MLDHLCTQGYISGWLSQTIGANALITLEQVTQKNQSQGVERIEGFAGQSPCRRLLHHQWLGQVEQLQHQRGQHLNQAAAYLRSAETR